MRLDNWRTGCVRALLLGACLALAPLPAVDAAARQAAAAKTGYYLALGADFAQGSQGFAVTTPGSTKQGYVYKVRDWLARIKPITLVNYSRYGECTGTFITGRADHSCPGKAPAAPAQLTEATTFLTAHAPASVRAITVDIGFNDLVAYEPKFLKASAGQRQALIAAALGPITRHWSSIFSALRQACKACAISAVNAYDPFPGGSVQVGAARVDVEPAFAAYNRALSSVAKRFGVRVVDAHAAFKGNELRYTWIAKGDVNPTTSGYSALAKAIVQTASARA